MNLFNKLVNNRFAPAYVPILVIAVWQLLGQLGYISTRTLPTPLKVAEAGVSLVKSGRFSPIRSTVPGELSSALASAEESAFC